MPGQAVICPLNWRNSDRCSVNRQQPLGVGLGRDDLQEGDELTGPGELVLDQAVVAELEELLDPDAGVPEHLDGRPGPERVAFLASEVSALA